jgi:16S rRNA processing protein RimM
VDVAVARIGRPRGLKGEVSLEIRTDDPEGRLAPGAVLATDPPERGPLTVVSARRDPKGWSAVFAEAGDRDAAEALRGAVLMGPAAPAEEDAWYPDELEGLVALLPDGTVAGEVVGVEALPAHDALKVREADGAIALVPLVRAIVPVVDVPGGRVVLDPPFGLLAVRPADDGG